MVVVTEINKHHYILTKTNKKFINFFSKSTNLILYDNICYFEYKQFKDYYIKYIHYKNILFKIIYYNFKDEIRNKNGPAWIMYHTNGKINKVLYKW